VDDRELRRAKQVSGIRGEALPSFAAVDRRRFELWLLSTALLVGLTIALGLLSMWSPSSMYALLVRPGVRFGVVGLAIGVSLYSIEKERGLRRISRMLTTAMSTRLHEISTLLEAGRAVNSTLELDMVLASMLAGATGLMPATSGSVMLLEGSELLVAAATGNDAALGNRVTVGEGIAGHVACTLEPLLLNGPADASRFPGLTVRSSTVGSALSVPLVERGDLLGILNLSSPREGEFNEYDLSALSLFAEHAAAAISKARLYSRSQQLASDLAHAATHDSLTGLGNRAELQRRANGEQALLFIDLDGFKQVNDRFGHAAGDDVLISVARRIVSHVAARDLVARFGGDEFAVLLEGVQSEAVAERIAERIRAAIDFPVGVGECVVRVTGSIGVAIPKQGGRELATLLREADKALYAAKAAGKACTRVSRHLSLPAARLAPAAG
jgi:diguanylate cyclase (GGDEF)-like protein